MAGTASGVVEMEASDYETGETGSNNIKECLEGVMLIDGAIATALVDWTTGEVIPAGHDLSDDFSDEAAGNTSVVLAEVLLMRQLGVRDRIEDILVTFNSRYHLIRLVRSYPSFFLYLVLNRDSANLAMARMQLADAEETLVLEEERTFRSSVRAREAMMSEVTP